MKKIFFILLFPFLLVSCVPAMLLGSSPSNPVSAPAGLASERVSPGSTWYFVVEYDLDFFYNHKERTSIFHENYFQPKPGLKLSRTVSGFFIRSVEAPEGWTFDIQRSYLQREVIEANPEFYTSVDKLFIVYAVNIPTETTGGSKGIFATLQRGSVTASRRVPLIVRISDAPNE
jgi:hypothetical protein